MKTRTIRRISIVAVFCMLPFAGIAQPYGVPDAGEPGDAMIQAFLGREAAGIDGKFQNGIKSEF